HAAGDARQVPGQSSCDPGGDATRWALRFSRASQRLRRPLGRAPDYPVFPAPWAELMQADYSVELGADDPALEIPWRADDGSERYFNLKRSPDLVLNIAEAREHPELSAFLSRINAPDFPLETAKCDAWAGTELAPEEEIFGAACKFASYVDLIFSDGAARLS